MAAAADATGKETEDATTPDLTATGTITFNDVDLIDTHTTSVAADAGNTLGGTLVMVAVSESATTEPGPVGWTYTVAANAIDHTAEGQTATEKFTVTVSDGHGGTVDQLVSITIHGTNEAPTITAASTDATGSVTEDRSEERRVGKGRRTLKEVDQINKKTKNR